MSEAKAKMTQEEILKSLDAIIDETIGTDEVAGENTAPAAETVAKSEESKDTNKQANGGEDKIKSGAPMTEEQKAEEAKKAKEKKDKEEKEAKEEAMKEQAEKSAQEEADLKKAADKDADDKKGAKESEDKDADDKKAKKMKKSLEELAAAGVDAEELELIKAWREENAEEEEVQGSADIAKSVAQAVGAQIEELKKSFDEKLSAKDDMIKSLSAEVKKLSTQPAHGKQSVDSLETIEKSGASNTEISKAQVLDTMLELQKAGKGINSRHIAEFEATRNLSNPQVKALVMEETKKRFQN